MSTTLVHVLTVVGKGAVEVEAACEEMLGRRNEQHAKSYGNSDWTEQDHREVERLCATLVNASRQLPIVYYAQYLDAWTIGDSRFCLLKWPDGRTRQICGSQHGLVFYPSKFAESFLAEIAVFQQSETYRNQAEGRWYVNHVKDAIESALWLQNRFLVVSISEVLGPSRQDHEIRAALALPIGLNDAPSRLVE